MWKRLIPLYNLYRRLFGTFTFDDPRPVQRSAPYTYFLPSERERDALRPGNLVKLIFRSRPPGVKWDAERMWVKLTAILPEGYEGTLDNQPSDMPQLKPDAPVHFQRFHIISTDIVIDEPEVRNYWERCLVDQCVVDKQMPVYYIYREEPDMAQNDERYPDSGWRIRGDYRHISDEELHARKVAYVALGVVLNADDSWAHLIDSPIGSAFFRSFETGEYGPE